MFKSSVRFVLSSLLLVLFTQHAIAETKIHEVQPYPIDAPVQLVIWGTEFGDNPQIYFGTHPVPLEIDLSSLLCGDMRNDPAPPIAPDGFDCVVADLPLGISNGDPTVPSGDYLLKIVAESTGINICGAKPSSLTFEYIPAD